MCFIQKKKSLIYRHSIFHQCDFKTQCSSYNSSSGYGMVVGVEKTLWIGTMKLLFRTVIGTLDTHLVLVIQPFWYSFLKKEKMQVVAEKETWIFCVVRCVVKAERHCHNYELYVVGSNIMVSHHHHSISSRRRYVLTVPYHVSRNLLLSCSLIMRNTFTNPCFVIKYVSCSTNVIAKKNIHVMRVALHTFSLT